MGVTNKYLQLIPFNVYFSSELSKLMRVYLIEFIVTCYPLPLSSSVNPAVLLVRGSFWQVNSWTLEKTTLWMKVGCLALVPSAPNCNNTQIPYFFPLRSLSDLCMSFPASGSPWFHNNCPQMAQEKKKHHFQRLRIKFEIEKDLWQEAMLSSRKLKFEYKCGIYTFCGI